MQRALSANAAAMAPGRIAWTRTAAAAACQKRPLPQQVQQFNETTGRRTAQVSSAARAGGPLPTALPRPAGGGEGRRLLLHQHGGRTGACFFSTNSGSAAAAAPVASTSSEEAAGGGGGGGVEMLSSDDDLMAGPDPSPSSPPSSSSASSGYTVVKHPPTPGWEFPPAPAGCEPKFAVIRLGNTQHKVTKDDVIVAEKVEGDIGTTLEISDVLLVGTRDSTTVGRPTVPGATVKLFVEEQTKDKKIIVLKKRRRKSSKTTKGHRREVTMLRVTEISS